MKRRGLKPASLYAPVFMALSRLAVPKLIPPAVAQSAEDVARRGRGLVPGTARLEVI